MKTTKKYFGLLAIVLLVSTSLNASTGKAAPKNCLQYAFDIGSEMFWAGGFSPSEITNMTIIHYQVCSGIL